MIPIDLHKIRGKIHCYTGNMRFLMCITVLVYLLLSAGSVRAETMLSPNFRIRFGNFNITSGTKSSSSYTLTDTVGQTAAGQFDSAGYTVKAGFQYIYTLYDFTFTISDLSIDFGTLNPNTFSTASNILTVSTPGQGYTVTAYETGRLQRSGTSDYIPDTGCNSGCTETSAGVWNSTSALGFGYNVDGPDKAGDFTNTTYFRPFPDISLGDNPAVILSSADSVRDRAATVTYKVNIGPVQAAGDYETGIIYIATPVY